MSKAELASARIKTWRDDPVRFVVEELKAEPDIWQAEALRAFAKPDCKRIAMQACAGPGKTTVLAWLAWNFMSCYALKGEHPKGAAVSVTADNLKDNLWPEIAKWQQQSEFLKRCFTWTKERIFANDYPETWFISARAWSKSANQEEQGRTLSGLHSKFVLYLIDESGDINPAILKSAEQGLSNCLFGRIVQAGNPTSLEGILHQAATRQRHLWHLISITGDPDDPKRSSRISLEWAKEQIELYGRDDPWVMAYILGQFPPSSINTLLGADEVRFAMERHLTEDQYSFAQKRIGIDVAREGDDRTVLFPRQGLASFRPAIMRTRLGSDIAARVALGKEKFGSELEIFDDTGGWAGAAIEAYELAGHKAFPVNFSGKALDPRYFNKRSEMWFLMANWIKANGVIPNIPELGRELTTPTYTFFKGKLRLEEKEKIKARLGFSPDLADALCLTFALPDMPASTLPQWVREQRNKTQADYDPLSADRMAMA